MLLADDSICAGCHTRQTKKPADQQWHPVPVYFYRAHERDAWPERQLLPHLWTLLLQPPVPIFLVNISHQEDSTSFGFFLCSLFWTKLYTQHISQVFHFDDAEGSVFFSINFG